MSARTLIRRPSHRAAWITAIAAVPAALLISGLAVAGGSYSAFSATTANPTNNWTTGTVVLTDDDANTALFTATGLKPGSTGTNCINVTSTGSLPSAVKFYSTAGVTSTGSLSDKITLTVQQGTASSTCASFTAASGAALYTGTLTSFGAYTSYTNGLATWSPTGTASETRAFKFTYSLDSSIDNTYQNKTASVGFTWEAQNS